MREIVDFIISALPWIAIGLFVAVSCVMFKAKSEGKEVSRFFKEMCWFPAGCFLFLAIIEMSNGNRSGGTTWLVLGVLSAVINFADRQKDAE